MTSRAGRADRRAALRGEGGKGSARMPGAAAAGAGRPSSRGTTRASRHAASKKPAGPTPRLRARTGGASTGILEAAVTAASGDRRLRLPQIAALYPEAGRRRLHHAARARIKARSACRGSNLHGAFDQPRWRCLGRPRGDARAAAVRSVGIRKRVHRRMPATVVIDVVERVPAAIWQNSGRLA